MTFLSNRAKRYPTVTGHTDIDREGEYDPSIHLRQPAEYPHHETAIRYCAELGAIARDRHIAIVLDGRIHNAGYTNTTHVTIGQGQKE